MSESNTGAAQMMASMPMKIETFNMPGFGAGVSNEQFDTSKYQVRYGKYCIGDPEATADLESIETRGLKGVDIVILNKEKFTFMDQYFLVVTYLERTA